MNNGTNYLCGGNFCLPFQTFICGPKQTLFTMLLEFLTLLIRDEISTKIQVETYFKVKIRVLKRSLAQKNTVCSSFCSLNTE